MQELAMVGTKMIPLEQLDPIYLDRGTFFGDGVYEVVRSYNGRIFAIDKHLQRFANSLEAIEISGVDMDDIKNRVQKAFEKTQIPNAKIYFHITRGQGPRNHIWAQDIQWNFFMTINELHDDAQAKKEGIAVTTHPDWRWKRCDIKSLNLLANVLARRDAEKKGAEEAILVDESGLITEGSGSAFFAIIEGALYTTALSENILPSITRNYVIHAAESINLPICQTSVKPGQAGGADELFIAVTTRDIVPVVKFDDHVIGSGQPGPITQKLIAAFAKFT